MKLYHATTEEAAASILKDGFKDNEATYMTVQMWRGVWFSDRPLDYDEGAKGTTLFCVNIPSKVIEPHEWIEEGKPYREFLLPSEIVNKYPVELCPDYEEPSIEASKAMLELAVNAASGGHDLTGFRPIHDQDGRANGYEARCRRCNLTAWVDDSGMMYILLSDVCPGNTQ